MSASDPSEYTSEDEDRDEMEIAAELVRDGWKGTSNKNRTIARLPEGQSGLDALRERSPGSYDWIMANAERQAADEFRRIHASEKDGTKKSLDYAMYMAFKRVGGQSSW